VANGTVGVAQSASADRLIDNTTATVGAQTVYRQRVDPIPSRASTYYSGTTGSVSVPATSEIVEVVCHCTTAGSLTIGGGSSITVPAASQFSTVLTDAPIVGIGAGSVVFTGTDSYFVRVRPVVA
jgi:hypothetical protein